MDDLRLHLSPMVPPASRHPACRHAQEGTLAGWTTPPRREPAKGALGSGPNTGTARRAIGPPLDLHQRGRRSEAEHLHRQRHQTRSGARLPALGTPEPRGRDLLGIARSPVLVGTPSDCRRLGTRSGQVQGMTALSSQARFDGTSQVGCHSRPAPEFGPPKGPGSFVAFKKLVNSDA